MFVQTMVLLSGIFHRENWYFEKFVFTHEYNFFSHIHVPFNLSKTDWYRLWSCRFRIMWFYKSLIDIEVMRIYFSCHILIQYLKDALYKIAICNNLSLLGKWQKWSWWFYALEQNIASSTVRFLTYFLNNIICYGHSLSSKR